LISALLAAGVCLAPPLYDMSGPACPPSAQVIECRCSECAMWDAVDGAEWYDVHRVDQDGTVHSVIGSSKVHPSYYDEQGVLHPREMDTFYCFAQDASTPIDGRRYVYTVRACSAEWIPTCGEWSAESVTYIGAPITCYENGASAPCPRI